MALGGILNKEGLIFINQKTPSKQEFNFGINLLDKDVPLEIRDYLLKEVDVLKSYYPNAKIGIGLLPITVKEL